VLVRATYAADTLHTSTFVRKNQTPRWNKNKQLLILLSKGTRVSNKQIHIKLLDSLENKS
jgi:hypothetical protein